SGVQHLVVGGTCMAPFSSSTRVEGRCTTQIWSSRSTATFATWPRIQLPGSGFGQKGSTRKLGASSASACFCATANVAAVALAIATSSSNVLESCIGNSLEIAHDSEPAGEVERGASGWMSEFVCNCRLIERYLCPENCPAMLFACVDLKPASAAHDDSQLERHQGTVVTAGLAGTSRRMRSTSSAGRNISLTS